MEEFLLKIVIIGNQGVGKSALLSQYVDNTFKDAHITTIGVDFRMKTLEKDDCTIQLQLWDTAGQERFRTIVSSYYRGCAGLVVVFDVTDLESFEKIPYWVSEASRHGLPECIKILVGNKTDLVDQRVIHTNTAQALADSLGVQYIETSAKTADNVHKAFDGMADTIVQSKRSGGLLSSRSIMADSIRLESQEVSTSWCSSASCSWS